MPTYMGLCGSAQCPHATLENGTFFRHAACVAHLRELGHRMLEQLEKKERLSFNQVRLLKDRPLSSLNLRRGCKPTEHNCGPTAVRGN